MAEKIAIVLAAGEGSRVRGFTKMLLPLASAPLLSHVLTTVAHSGCTRCVVVLPCVAQPSQQGGDTHGCDDRDKSNNEERRVELIDWVDKNAQRILSSVVLNTVTQPAPRGTADAISCATDFLKSHCELNSAEDMALVINGDTPLVQQSTLRRVFECARDLSLSVVGTVGDEERGGNTVGAHTVGAHTVGAHTVGAHTVSAHTVSAPTANNPAVSAPTANITAVNTSQHYDDEPQVSHDDALVMATFFPPQCDGYGRVWRIGSTDKTYCKGAIARIIEHKEWLDQGSPEHHSGECYSGIVAGSVDVLDRVAALIKGRAGQTSEAYITALPTMFKGVYALPIQDAHEVHGVNTLAELACVEDIWQQKKRAQLMESGVRLVAPDTVWLSHDSSVGINTTIEPHVMIRGGVSIGSHCLIRSYSYLEGVTIGNHCVIGPFARVRPHSVLQDQVRVGNFVEIKNTTLHQGVKANHLAYIGDATVKHRSNIGAGTITCNYDGYEKHPSYIGEECSIGANSALVAPINIGDRAIIGAGSTLRDDVPSDTVVVVRASPTLRPRKSRNTLRSISKSTQK